MMAKRRPDVRRRSLPPTAVVLGYLSAASARPKLRVTTPSNSFESAGRKRRAEATAAIIQGLIAGKAARPTSRGRNPASVSDRNIREQICTTATGGSLCHRYVIERASRAGP
jgi:hypothetical protein